MSYISDPDSLDKPFDTSSIPKVSKEQAAKESARGCQVFVQTWSALTHRLGPSSLETIGVPSTSKAATPPPQTAAEAQSAYAQQLADVPEFAEYGPVLNSSAKPSQLTEAETEYQVSCVKHIFKEHIVFQVRSSFFLSSVVPAE